MKQFVRLFALILFASYSSITAAQNPYFGVRAGLNLSHMQLDNTEGRSTGGTQLAPGLNIGGTMEYRIIPELSITTNLMFTTKGYSRRYKDNFQGVEIKSREQLLLFYFELPVYAKYEFQVFGVKAFAGLGPFVSYGYWGKYLWHREGGGETEWGREDVYWGTDPEEHDLVNLDYGVGLTVGGKLDNFVLDLGYHYSIPNISSATDQGQIARNGVGFISVSYFFSRFYKYGEGNY